jgi:catechol 2,3-dioxygenase-like lactoylglutathione lyase family enzyme
MEKQSMVDAAVIYAGLSEIAIGVADVRVAAHFYTDVVGLALETIGDQGASLWTGAPHNSPRLLLTSRAQRPLPERDAPTEEGRPSVATRGPLATFQPGRIGPSHFALRVPEPHLADVVQRMKDKGVEVDGPVYFDWMKATSHYFLDRDGNLVELWTPIAARGR